MKKKNGFISISVIYTFFFVFLMMLLFIISRYTDNRTLLKVIKKDIKDNLSNSYKSEFSFGYTGEPIEFEIPLSGIYKIELWGADGGSYNTYSGGKGSYVSGNVTLDKGQKIYIYVGNNATEINTASYNGGGAHNSSYGASGGGATDIRLEKGTWNDFNSLKSRIMVAAGGGGANRYGEGGAGGDLTGMDGAIYSTYHATGGFQNSGGYRINTTGQVDQSASVLGHFGYAVLNQSGGGGGYYGGASSPNAGAGGGSSFISGYVGCNAINPSSTANNIIHLYTPIHYSNIVFTNALIISGKANVPTKPMEGLDGYAQITLINTI